MMRSRFMLASALCSFAGMTLAPMTGARAQAVYIDEGVYAAPPAYVAPTMPPSYCAAPEGYVAAPAYTAPTAPLAVVPPVYVERVAPLATPRERVIRRVRPAYPRYDYGYVTYGEW
jgi:hypothetical protein